MLLTVNEAAILANRTPRAIYQWIEAKRLRAVLDVDGIRKVDSADVMALEPKMKRGRPKGSAKPNATRRDEVA